MSTLTDHNYWAEFSIWASGILLCSFCLIPLHAFGQALTLRAVGPHITDDLISYVARNATPFNLSSMDLNSAKPKTARDIIRSLCGSVREAYWAEFLEVNRIGALSLSDPLLDAGNYFWPRCLWVDPTPQTVTLFNNDSAARIYKRLTGSHGSDETIARFFGVKSVDEIKTISAGSKLTGAYRTLPITVIPKKGTLESFSKAVNRIALDSGKTSAAMILVSDATQGEIVVAKPSTSLTEASQCAPFKVPSIDAQAIQYAYLFARSAGTKMQDRARILVVDNGFFGADPNNDKGPFTDSPFPEKYFRKSADKASLIAERIDSNTIDLDDDRQPHVRPFIDPINFTHGLEPDETSGHGTHVTGLILGGPMFSNYVDTLKDNGEPWAEITILNVGKGGVGLVVGAHGRIQNYLSINKETPFIVNMSIAYDESVSNIRALFESILNGISKRSLLVVAAGNGGVPVSSASLIPASLGGILNNNVITVAAYDATGTLPQFSNYDSDYVDIAAPGCEISSWYSNTSQTISLSGTSMATPLVTFAAALLRSLNSTFEGRDIKSRLIASGDLLDRNDLSPIAYKGVRLNITKSLYWSHDYIRLNSEEFLGRVQQFPDSTRKCNQEKRPHISSEIWALKKRPDGSGVLFLGKNNRQIIKACESQDATAGDLVFTPTHRITPGGKIEALANITRRAEPMKGVMEVVIRSDVEAN